VAVTCRALEVQMITRHRSINTTWPTSYLISVIKATQMTRALPKTRIDLWQRPRPTTVSFWKVLSASSSISTTTWWNGTWYSTSVVSSSTRMI